MGMRRTSATILAAASLLLSGPPPTQADSTPIEVDMQLVLAVDISFSISRDQQDIQRRGYVAAFRDPAVIRAITSGYRGRIAITYMEWAGEDIQFQVVPWVVISDSFSAHAFAQRLEQVPVNRRGRTSLSRALTAALALFRQSPFVSNRQVVDISGDGFNNNGPRVDGARDALVYHGVTINGLPLMTGDAGQDTHLGLYYQDCVIGGLSAFMMPMVQWDKFATTLNRKLIAEIAGPGNLPEHARLWHAADKVAPQQLADCLFGEKEERRQYIKQLEDAVGKGRAPRWIPREEDWPTPE